MPEVTWRAPQKVAIHQLELFINEGIEPEHELTKTGLEWIKEKQKNPDNIFHSEVIVFSKELSIAGTIDLLIHNKKTDAYHLLDWKTNKRIDQKSFGDKKGILNLNVIRMFINKFLPQIIILIWFN